MSYLAIYVCYFILYEGYFNLLLTVVLWGPCQRNFVLVVLYDLDTTKLLESTCMIIHHVSHIAMPTRLSLVVICKLLR